MSLTKAQREIRDKRAAQIARERHFRERADRRPTYWADSLEALIELDQRLPCVAGSVSAGQYTFVEETGQLELVEIQNGARLIRRRDLGPWFYEWPSGRIVRAIPHNPMSYYRYLEIPGSGPGGDRPAGDPGQGVVPDESGQLQLL